MIKFTSLFFLSLLFVPVYSQHVEFVKESFESGKCYSSSKYEDKTESVNLTYEQSFILEVVPGNSEKELIRFAVKDLKSKGILTSNSFKKTSKDEVMICVGKASTKLVKKKSCDCLFDSEGNPTPGYFICVVEIPAQYRTIKLEELNVDSVDIEINTTLVEARIFKTYVDEEPDTLNENQFYFEAGYYSALKEFVVPNLEADLVRKVQKELKKRGYKVKVNNVFDDKTRETIRKFQDDNNLNNGGLSAETLKFLGLKK